MVRGSLRRAYIVLRRLRQFALAGLVLAPAMARADSPEMRPNVAYGPRPMEQGDLYIPAEPHGRKPAVVVIHGGGWIEGSRQADSDLSKLIASHGLVVFNIDYRLADKNRPETRWPAQLVDAQLAVRFLRAHAAEFGIEPSRIGAIGDSAGAQLAVFLGVLPRIVPGDGSALFAGERPDVMAVVDQFGPMDLPGMGIYATDSIAALFGPTMPPGDVLLTASPLPSVGAHSAAVYIVHGEEDEVVPFQQSRQLADTLHAHGVFVKLVPYQGKHAYGGVPGEQIGKLQIDAVDWLSGRLWH